MLEERINRLLNYKINVDKGIEYYGDRYEEELSRFINGYDFMRLGQAINNNRWESAAMCIRRMSIDAQRLGLDCFAKQFAGLRQGIARKEQQEVKNILGLVIVKRIQIQDVLRKY